MAEGLQRQSSCSNGLLHRAKTNNLQKHQVKLVQSPALIYPFVNIELNFLHPPLTSSKPRVSKVESIHLSYSHHKDDESTSDPSKKSGLQLF